MNISPPNELIPAALHLDPALLERAAATFGTPLYLYDRQLLRSSMRALVEALPAGASVYYSAKANPAVAIIRELAGLCAGVEISSRGELLAALEAGVAPKRLIYVGPAKGRAELVFALETGVGIIVAESAREVALIFTLSRELGLSVEVLLRLNPGAAGTRGALRMAGATQFGMDPATAEALLREYCAGDNGRAVGGVCGRGRGRAGARIVGIHGYLGTRLLDAVELDANLGLVLDMAVRLQKRCGVRFSCVDMGGGFGVPLYGGERELDICGLGGLLAERFRRYLEAHPWTEILAFKAGRYPVAPSGVLVTRVVDVRRTGGKLFALVDGGLHVIGGRDGYLGARCGPFRVVREGGFLSAVNGGSVAGAESGAESGACEGGEPLTVCGPLCTPYDRLAAGVVSPCPQEGDLLVFYQAGAYGASASAGMFLSRGFPAEAFADGGELKLICRGWGPEEALCAQKI